MRDVLFKAIYFGLIVLLVFSPFAYASVEIWSQSICWFIIIALSGFWLLKINLDKDVTLKRTPLDLSLITFALLAVISTVLSIYRNASLIYLYRVISCGLTFYIIIQTINSRKKLIDLSLAVVIIAGLLSALGILKYFGMYMLGIWQYVKEDYGGFSAYISTSHFTGYIGMVIPLALGLLLMDIRPIKKILVILSISIMMAAELIVKDRGGWIQLIFATGFFFMLIRRTRLLKSKFWLILFIAAIFFWAVSIFGIGQVLLKMKSIFEFRLSNSSDATIWERWLYWKGTLKIILAHPWLGTGLGTFQWAYPEFRDPRVVSLVNFSHQDFLQIAAEMGIIGLGAFLWFLYLFFKNSFEYLKKHNMPLKGIVIGSISGSFGLLVHSLYDFNLHIPANVILFVTLVAIGMLSCLQISEDKSALGMMIKPNKVLVNILGVLILGVFSIMVLKGYLAYLHYEKGLIYEKKINYTKAIEEYKKAAALDATNSSYFKNLGHMYAIRAKFNPSKYKKPAADNYKKAIALNPFDAWLRIDLAAIYTSWAEIDLALSEFKKATKLDPNNAFFHNLFGIFYLEIMHDKSEAILEFKKTLSINSGDETAKSFLGRLE